MGYREPGESLRERLDTGLLYRLFLLPGGPEEEKNRYGIHNMFKTLP